MKAVHLLINIHKRGRKCLQKADVGLLTRVMISRSVGNNVFLGDLGVSLPILIKSAETHEEPEKISFGWFGHLDLIFG